MARNSFKKTLNTRIKQERTHRGISGADLLEQRNESMAPNPRHMVAFSSDDLPALRSGRRPPHTPPSATPSPAAQATPAPTAPTAPTATTTAPAPAAGTAPPASAPQPPPAAPAAQAPAVPSAPAKSEAADSKTSG